MCQGNSRSNSGSSSSGSRPNMATPSSAKCALREQLSALRLPPGLLSAVLASHQSCDVRVWVIDNSSFMKVRDSHLGHVDSDGKIQRLNGVSRWHELQEAVKFYSKLASKCWMPTKFWLVNEPSGEAAANNNAGNKKYAICWSTPEDVPSELGHLKHVMKHDALEHEQCRLTNRLTSLIKTVEKEAPSLLANNKHIAVVICTQGVPTNSKGQTGSSIREEFRNELKELIKLPVKVILRLTTDDSNVVERYNDMDSSFDGVDVLDDYWGEAMEVHLHNPWLTYSPGLHRLREAGLAPGVFDELDERPLTLDEIHEFCTIMFLGDDSQVQIPLPPYQPTTMKQTGRQSWLQAWTPFMRGLKKIVEREKLQWNPMYKQMMPWINCAKLEMNLMEQLKAKDELERKRGGFEKTDSRKMFANMHGARPPRRGRDRRNSATVQGENESEKPDPKLWQSTRGVASEPPQMRREIPREVSLTKVLQKWSHQPPSYKVGHSLQRLLITVPRLLFPPMNTAVEPHVYFSKWKKLDRDAFDDVDQDSLKELLKRAMRKAKFFLHPDKLPKDLTENQTLLFKAIWDVITERETATLG